LTVAPTAARAGAPPEALPPPDASGVDPDVPARAGVVVAAVAVLA
jgi:hypothetical protein